MVAVKEGVAESPVSVLRNTAYGQSVKVADTVPLPQTAALGTFVPFTGFEGAYNAVSLYRIFVRMNNFF